MQVRLPQHNWVRAALGSLAVLLVGTYAWLAFTAITSLADSKRITALEESNATLQKAVDVLNANAQVAADQFTFCQDNPTDAICEKPLVVAVPPEVVKDNPSAVTAVPGSTGDTGAPGATGEQGEAGATGASGSALPGQPGATGEVGASGSTGNTGATGQEGAGGATGETGATGPPGESITGPPGPPGPPGADGAMGPQGEQGPQGPPGSSPTILTVSCVVNPLPGRPSVCTVIG